MSILDRMYLARFVQNYLIMLVCLMSLFIVIDLFTNLNDFTNQRGGFAAVAKHIAGYYSVQSTLIFDKLSEPLQQRLGDGKPNRHPLFVTNVGERQFDLATQVPSDPIGRLGSSQSATLSRE